MKIIAIAPVGAEYLYRCTTAHTVPEKNTEKIRSALNNAAYCLRAGETWHLYDVGPYDNAYAYATLQRFYIRSGRIYEGGRS